MRSLHPYSPLRYPPTSLEQRLSIVHPGPDTIQVAPSRMIGGIFPNLMCQPKPVDLNQAIKDFEIRPRAKPLHKHYTDIPEF
jgi:hypothetical protein